MDTGTLRLAELHKLTSLGLVLLVLVDEEETGALGAQRQENTLDDGGDESEAQQEWPQIPVAHERLQSKDLKKNRQQTKNQMQQLLKNV